MFSAAVGGVVVVAPIPARPGERVGCVATERSHYPVAIYVLTVICALGLACVAVGIADGWVLIAAGVTAISASLARLHVILDRRRAAVGLRPLPLDGPTPPKRHS